MVHGYDDGTGVAFMKSVATRFAALAAAASLAFGAPASAAVQARPVTYTPWVALSAFASQSSSAALCGTAASTAATTSTQQAGTPGCVLPQVDAPPVVASEAASPVSAVPAAATVGAFPLLLGLAALAGIGALFLAGGNGGGNSIVGRPVSP